MPPTKHTAVRTAILLPVSMRHVPFGAGVLLIPVVLFIWVTGDARDATHQQDHLRHQTFPQQGMAMSTGSQTPMLEMMPEPKLSEGH